MRFGAVFRYCESYGAVRFCDKILRCGSVRLSKTGNPTVRFGAVLENRKSYGAVRFSDVSYGPVRFGSPLSRFFYGAVAIPVGKAVQLTLFFTVHRIYIYKQYYTAVSYGSQAFIGAQ